MRGPGSEGPALSFRGVECLVEELVGAGVLVALHVADRPAPELLERIPHLPVKRLEVLLLHLVVAAHLLDDQLGVPDKLDLVGSQLLRELDPEQEGAVLGNVVGGVADRLAALGEGLVRRVSGDGGDRCGSRIAT